MKNADEKVNNKPVYTDYEEEEMEEYIPCSTYGDYSPSSPWDAPGMKISDFI